MGNKSLFPVVAVPHAFFGTFFRIERNYFPLRVGSPTVRAVVGAPASRRWFLLQQLQAGDFPPAPAPLRAVCRSKTALHKVESALLRRSRGWGLLPAKLVYSVTSRGLSSGQTTGAACTAGCSVRCLHELRVFPVGEFRAHSRWGAAAENENDQHVQNTRWSFL